MAFPSHTFSTPQTFTSSTTHNVTMPATVDAGDLLIVWFIAENGGTTITNPGSWTQLGLSTASTSTQGRVICSAIVASGTEGGTTVNFATDSARVGIAIVTRVTAATWGGTLASDVVISAATIPVAAVDTPANPASVNATWGSADNLFLVFGALADDPVDYSAAPSDYSGLVTTSTGITGTGCGAGAAYRQLAAASDDPGTFTQTTPTSLEYTSTLVIEPASGGGGGGGVNPDIRSFGPKGFLSTLLTM